MREQITLLLSTRQHQELTQHLVYLVWTRDHPLSTNQILAGAHKPLILKTTWTCMVKLRWSCLDNFLKKFSMLSKEIWTGEVIILWKTLLFIWGRYRLVVVLETVCQLSHFPARMIDNKYINVNIYINIILYIDYTK